MPRSVGLLLCALTVAGCAIRAPGEPSGVPTASPSHSPEATASVGASAAPTPVPPSPTPIPTPDDAALEMRAIGCDGGVVLHWTASTHPDFHHYVALRSPEFEIEPGWPPIAPAVDWGDTYATDRFVTSAVDASIIPSSTLWFYRVMAYDAAGTVLGASRVRSARMSPVDALGAVTVESAGDGRTRIAWGRYRGAADCFTAYRVLAGTGGTPSTLVGTVSDRDVTELVTDAVDPGTAVTLRVEAVRTTPLGSFVVGRTEAVSLTLPGP